MRAFSIATNFLLFLTVPASSHDLRGLASFPVGVELVSGPELRRLADQQNEEDAKYVIARLLIWKAGQRLSACFFDGTTEEKAFVVSTVDELVKLTAANLEFDFGSEPGFRVCQAKSPELDVRVSFRAGCCRAYVGTNSHFPDAAVTHGPSVNIEGVLNENEAERRRIVMHEFLHVIGLEHEHQSPKSPCPLEFKKSEIMESTGWNESKYKTNMESLNQDSHAYEWSSWDKSSIMQYYFKASELKNGKDSPCFRGANLSPSEMDIKAVQEMYPYSSSKVPAVRAKALLANIALGSVPKSIQMLAAAMAK